MRFKKNHMRLGQHLISKLIEKGDSARFESLEEYEQKMTERSQRIVDKIWNMEDEVFVSLLLND